MKNILSYCIFEIKNSNKSDNFINVFNDSILGSRALFLDWEIRVYTNVKNLSSRLDSRANPIIIYIEEPIQYPCEGMMWRWKPLFENDVKYIASRDTDALVIPDERFAIEEFIQLKGWVHNLSASISHNILMMGGLSCVDAQQFRIYSPYKNYQQLVSGFNLNYPGADQDLIINRIFHVLEMNSIQHTTLKNKNRPSFISSHTKFIPYINYNLEPKIGISKSLIPEANSLATHAGTPQFMRNYAKMFYEKYYLEKITPHSLENPINLKNIRTVYSSDINKIFDFFIPITGLFWKQLGFEPFVYLIGTNDEWKIQRRLIIDILDTKKIEYKFIDPILNCKTSTIAQVIRLYAFCDLYNPAGYITTDVDMWPLASKDFWNRSTEFKTWSFQGNPEFFMCYVSASRNIWKYLIKNTMGGCARDELIKQLSRGPGLNQNIPWEYDQILLTNRIKEWDGPREEDRRIMGPNYLPDGRVDRYKWQFSKKQPHLKDCHVLRPGYTDENWSRLRILISEYLPNELKVLDKYREEYLKIVT